MSKTYGHAHAKARAALLADDPPCVYCGDLATVADHQPPVALHQHEDGTGCCEYVPSCKACSYKQAGEVSELLRKSGAGRAPMSVEFAEPEQSPGPADPVWSVPWLTDLLEVPETATWPRFMSAPHPRAVGSLGLEFEAWSLERSGVPLRWWQRLVARRVLEVDADGSFVWLMWLMSVARQCGKTHLVVELLMWATAHVRDHWQAESVLFAARTLQIAESVVQPLMRWADEAEGWSSKRGKGAYGVHGDDGRTLTIRATGSAYGSTNGMAVIDESWDVKQTDISEGVRPTLVAAEGMLGLTSTAHRKATSLTLNERDRAFEQVEEPSTRLLIEWSADRAMAPDDRAGWRQASPHWTPFREEMIADALRTAQSGELLDPSEPDPMAAFTAQYLNQWPIRQTRRGTGDPFLDPGVWATSLSTTDVAQFQKVIGIEDNYGRGLSVAVAGLTAEEHVGIVGQQFVDVEAGWAFVLQHARDAVGFAVGASLMVEGNSRGLPQMVPGTSQTLRSGLAVFRQLCNAGEVRHDGGEDLAQQMMAARVREGSSGMTIISNDRKDMVKAAAYAVGELQRQRASVAAVW